MYSIDVPAGCPIRLTATSRVGSVEVHRWQVRVLTADGHQSNGARLSYGSQIGGVDREQRIEIPAQHVDCSLEVVSARRNGDRWDEEQSVASTDAAGAIRLGFVASEPLVSDEHDVLLSFDFRHPASRA